MRSAVPAEIARHPLECVRERTARVAARARFVRIDPEGLETYARALADEPLAADAVDVLPGGSHDDETRAAFVLSLDAINFGSGWFPVLRKRAGCSGYRTIEAAVIERFETVGPWTAAQIASIEAAAVADWLGQPRPPSPVDDLMELFARALRDLGNRVTRHHGGSFAALVASAQGSAESLVRELLAMPLYQDIADYDGLAVPFLKRAQITVADLARALPGEAGRFRDLDRLTMFADNLVPHVLRLDGVLRCDPALVERIEREELLPWGTTEEVELRACAVHAVELLVERLRATRPEVNAARLDAWLWLRGGQPRYKERPRHRTRCPYY